MSAHDITTSLIPYATKRVIKKGAILLYQGEAPRMAHLIQEGYVKVYTINDAGEEQIVTFHGPNDLFPGSWIFNKTATTLYYYETFSDCVLLTLLREQLHECLQKASLMKETLDYYVTNYTAMMMRVTALEQSRAREKILLTLYYLLFRFGQPAKNGRFIIQLPLTQAVIASLVGLTRETTSIELSRLKKERVIRYSHYFYTVDKQLLERTIGEDNFQEMPLEV